VCVCVCLQFVHAHLVRLIGVVTLGDPNMVVLEYCEFGSLDSYLKKNEVPDEIKARLMGCRCVHFAAVLTAGTADPPCW
jgi:serine/threonine protein kinase